MRHSKLQGVLDQLSDLTSAELSEVKAAVNERLERHLRTLGANGDLTAEEWQILEGKGNGLLSCVKMVRERIGLGLIDSKAYVDRARTKGRPRANTFDDSGIGPQRDSEVSAPNETARVTRSTVRKDAATLDETSATAADGKVPSD